MRERHFHEYTRRDLVLMMAEEILSMDSEIETLRAKNKHLEEINEILRDSINSTEKHNNAMTGAMLFAAIGANDAAVELLKNSD